MLERLWECSRLLECWHFQRFPRCGWKDSANGILGNGKWVGGALLGSPLGSPAARAHSAPLSYDYLLFAQYTFITHLFSRHLYIKSSHQRVKTGPSPTD